MTAAKVLPIEIVSVTPRVGVGDVLLIEYEAWAEVRVEIGNATFLPTQGEGEARLCLTSDRIREAGIGAGRNVLRLVSDRSESPPVPFTLTPAIETITQTEDRFVVRPSPPFIENQYVELVLSNDLSYCLAACPDSAHEAVFRKPPSMTAGSYVARLRVDDAMSGPDTTVVVGNRLQRLWRYLRA